MTAVLARFGADIRHAKIVTLGHEVVDAFYVRRFDESDGVSARATRKIADGDETDRLREALLAVLLETS